MTRTNFVIPVEKIERSVFLIRDQRVMLDRDLAALYGVPTKGLNRAVKRNKGRFPEDFMFQLTHQEAKCWWTEVMDARLRSQNVTLKRGQHLKYRPYAFTEHGILMLSSVLNSAARCRAKENRLSIKGEAVSLSFKDSKWQGF